MRQWEELPEFTTAFGLFPEPEGWRDWQAWLDTFSLPHIHRCDSTDVQVFYTDGACLFPQHAAVRVASGAALRGGAINSRRGGAQMTEDDIFFQDFPCGRVFLR